MSRLVHVSAWCYPSCNMMESWGLPLNSSSSRCLAGPFNVCLGLFAMGFWKN